MPYYVPELITKAFNTAGVVAREFETVTAQQGQDGFDLLNEILADKTVEEDMIPYYLNYTFNAVTGQEKYFIPDLINLDTLTFFIQSVRYSMQSLSRRQYFQPPRANNVESLPYDWHLERCFGGANLFLYFLPDINYPMEAWGQFRLASVNINQDLSLTLDPFYINYLKYDLADRICTFYNYTVPEKVAKLLRKYNAMISKQSAQLDMTCNKVSTLGRYQNFSYAQVNIGKGFTAP